MASAVKTVPAGIFLFQDRRKRILKDVGGKGQVFNLGNTLKHFSAGFLRCREEHFADDGPDTEISCHLHHSIDIAVHLEKHITDYLGTVFPVFHCQHG